MSWDSSRAYDIGESYLEKINPLLRGLSSLSVRNRVIKSMMFGEWLTCRGFPMSVHKDLLTVYIVITQRDKSLSPSLSPCLLSQLSLARFTSLCLLSVRVPFYNNLRWASTCICLFVTLVRGTNSTEWRDSLSSVQAGRINLKNENDRMYLQSHRKQKERLISRSIEILLYLIQSFSLEIILLSTRKNIRFFFISLLLRGEI